MKYSSLFIVWSIIILTTESFTSNNAFHETPDSFEESIFDQNGLDEYVIPIQDIPAPSMVSLFYDRNNNEFETWTISFISSDENSYRFKIYPDGIEDDAFNYEISKSIKTDEMDYIIPGPSPEPLDTDNHKMPIINHEAGIKLVIDEPVLGYNMTADIYIGEEDENTLKCTYHLSNGDNSFDIDEYIYWDWKEDALLDIDANTYHVKDYKSLHGSLQLIDVDFDGKEELCFENMGYKDFWYHIYKIHNNRCNTMKDPFVLMNGNFVIDESSRTITITEGMGYGDVEQYTYGLRENIVNIFDPMEEKTKVNTLTTLWGATFVDTFQAGKYASRSEDINYSKKYSLHAEYSRIGDRLVLQSLVFVHEGKVTKYDTTK